MRGNVYLVGFMGSGKSTIGGLLARALNRKFVDMDVLLEKEFGKPISQVFKDSGEKTFRAAENKLVKRLSAKTGLVVATGGGVVELEGNRKAMMASGKVVYLDGDLAGLKARLSDQEKTSRPLWQDEQALQNLLEHRRMLYSEADLTVPTGPKGPEEMTVDIVAALFPEERFSALLGGTECPVVGTFAAPEALKQYVQDRRSVVLTDRTVARLHLERFRSLLRPSLEIVVPPGERSKSLKTLARVYADLIVNRLDRDDLLVAVGGGVVTDLGAYAASTYKRGMDFVLVSTTLLGCVDAAVGGKAAVNLGRAKNVIGSFSKPSAVVLDFAALGTLGRRQVTEGLVEAYKTGLVVEPNIAGLIEKQRGALISGDLPLLSRVACMSARAKAQVVSEDFREAGLRRILNFGHTFGHAVEGFHDFRVTHGQAVALGMKVATEISRSRGLISDETASRIRAALQGISPRPVQSPPLEDAWEIMLQDKKIRKGRMVFVLLEGAGKAVCVDDVTKEELQPALKNVEDNAHG